MSGDFNVTRVIFPCDCPLGVKIGESRGGVAVVTGFHKLRMRILHEKEASIDLPVEDISPPSPSETSHSATSKLSFIEDSFVDGPGRACGEIRRGDAVIRVNDDSCVGLPHEEIKRKVSYMKNQVGSETLTISFSSEAMAVKLASGTAKEEEEAISTATTIDARRSFAHRRASAIESHRKRWLLRNRKKMKVVQNQRISINRLSPGQEPIIKVPLLEQYKIAIGGWPQYSGDKDIDKKVDIKLLADLAFKGMPDAICLRSTVWRLLLGYLPTELNLWQSTLEAKRSLYREWRADLYPKDARRRRCIGDSIAINASSGRPASAGDSQREETLDPLSPSLDSHWSKHWEESALLGEIWKDVKRTNSQYSFFSRERDPTIADTLERVLFLFAKLNPGLRYVQGMNEVLAPLLYCFFTDVPKKDTDDYMGYNNRSNLEADVFFCFQRVMSHMTDVFVEELDESDCGIDGSLLQLEKCIKMQNKAVYLHLRKLELQPKFYAMRWLTTLLAREFDMPDTIRLWDSLFSDQSKFEFLVVVCASMVTTQSSALLNSDFSSAIQLLQQPYTLDVEKLLQTAGRAYNGAYRGGLDLPDDIDPHNGFGGSHSEEVEKALMKIAVASSGTASRLLGKFRTWASSEKKRPQSKMLKSQTSPIRMPPLALDVGAGESAMKSEEVYVNLEDSGASIVVVNDAEMPKPGSHVQIAKAAESDGLKKCLPKETNFKEPESLFADVDDGCNLFDSD